MHHVLMAFAYDFISMDQLILSYTYVVMVFIYYSYHWTHFICLGRSGCTIILIQQEKPEALFLQKPQTQWSLTNSSHFCDIRVTKGHLVVDLVFPVMFLYELIILLNLLSLLILNFTVTYDAAFIDANSTQPLEER